MFNLYKSISPRDKRGIHNFEQKDAKIDAPHTVRNHGVDPKKKTTRWLNWQPTGTHPQRELRSHKQQQQQQEHPQHQQQELEWQQQGHDYHAHRPRTSPTVPQSTTNNIGHAHKTSTTTKLISQTTMDNKPEPTYTSKQSHTHVGLDQTQTNRQTEKMQSLAELHRMQILLHNSAMFSKKSHKQTWCQQTRSHKHDLIVHKSAPWFLPEIHHWHMHDALGAHTKSAKRVK